MATKKKTGRKSIGKKPGKSITTRLDIDTVKRALKYFGSIAGAVRYAVNLKEKINDFNGNTK